MRVKNTNIQDSSRQGQVQEFEICTLVNGLWTSSMSMDCGYQLDHSLSQRLLKHLLDNVLLEHVRLICVLPLAVHLFFEQVEGVILSHFYSLGFIIRDLHA